MKTKLVALCVIFVPCAFGYQESVHEQISSRALARSVVVADPDTLTALGLAPQNQFPSSDRKLLGIAALVRFGARHEDSGNRSVNHFYDPVNDRALNVAGLSLTFEKSPDWAVDGVDQPEPGNHSYVRVLQHLVSALTASTKAERVDNWGLVFQGLGHVIHHIQDMAQPQHVRNDAHLDTTELSPIGKFLLAPMKDPSYYERYTTGSAAKWAPLLDATPAPPALSQVRAYWHTTDSRGIADFTNQNFVSKDSNFELQGGASAHNARYQKPQPVGSETVSIDDPALAIAGARALCERLRDDPRVHAPADTVCVIEFVNSSVVDARTGEMRLNRRAASLSVFDQAIQDLHVQLMIEGTGVDRVHTLNRFNFDTAHEFLLPRAVAYSAGLINQIFRGRMQIRLAEARDGEVAVEVVNTSLAGNDFGSGRFSVYYDSTAGTRKALASSDGGNLPVGASRELSFTLPTDLDLQVPSPFVLVFEGQIGAENGVSGLVFDVPGAYNGFTFQALLPDRQDFPRLLHQVNGQWQVYPQGNLPAGGNVDWRGWYVGGTPTRTLTWHGWRYGIRAGTMFARGPTIYEDGLRIAVAPWPVLGAALQKDADGSAWVIAICEATTLDQDIVVRRPLKKSTSPLLYHPATNPDGWRVMGRFQRPAHLSETRESWQFNGSGTEAQTMRVVMGTQPADRTPYTRLKMRVVGDSAGFEDLGNTRVKKTETRDMIASRTVDGQTYDYCDDGGTINSRWSRTTTGDPVVAVDYLDETEVLARMNVASSTVGQETGAVSWGKPLQLDEQTTTKGRWTLDINGAQHELFTEDASFHRTRNYPEMTMVDRDAWMQASIVGLDLRSGLVVVRRRHREWISETKSPTSQGEATISFATHAEYGAGAPVNRVTGKMDVMHHVKTAYIGGESSATEHCFNGQTVRSGHWTSQEQFDVNLFSISDPSAHLLDVLASSATDRAGNVFLSVRHRDFYTKQLHYFSYLTNADPVSLTGVDPANPFFEYIRPR